MQNKSKAQSKGSEYWAKHIRKWKDSGLSKAEYARQNELSRHAFYYWYNKLERKTSNTAVVPLPFTVPDPREQQTKPITLNVGQRFQVDIQGDFDSSVLQKLISTLEGME